MELERSLVERVLRDDLEALEPRLRATLEVLRAVSVDPEPAAITARVRAALLAGVGREALDDAIHICCAFNIIVRAADTFDFEVPREPELSRQARLVYKRGYGR